MPGITNRRQQGCGGALPDAAVGVRTGGDVDARPQDNGLVKSVEKARGSLRRILSRPHRGGESQPRHGG